MSIFWNIFFWLALVAIAGMIAWTVVRIVTKNAETRKYRRRRPERRRTTRQLPRRARSRTQRVLQTLGTIEERLAAIEKTLTEIP